MSTPTTQEKQSIAELFHRGRLADAARLAAELTQRHPQHGFAWNALGGALARMGRTREAIAPLRQAAALMPAQAAVHCNLGAALLGLDSLEEAEASLRRALELSPEHAEAWNNLGVALRKQGRLGEALASLQRALQEQPGYAEAHNNLGLALHDAGRFGEADSAFQRALQIRADFAEALHNRSITQQHLGQLEDAVRSSRQALLVRPDYAAAHVNLALGLQQLGRFVEAEESCRRALQIEPGHLLAQSVLLFCLNYLEVPAPRMLDEARRYGRMAAAAAGPRHAEADHAAAPSRLKVGFVSGDLREHPVGFFLESLLQHVDPGVLDLVAYPTDFLSDALTDRIRPRFSAWRPIGGLGDEAAARTIRADGVHILVDLSGHTARNRLPVFARKPAPVQVSWLGYFATTGVAEIDYILADPWTLPEGDEGQYTEQVWRLPRTRLCFTAPHGDLPVADLPALRDGRVTFCCFNNLSKLNPAVLALWTRILDATPASRLLLKAGQFQDPAVRESLRRQFAPLGVGPDRLFLEEPQSRERYLLAYGRADIALDPFPFAGATTTVEALWMGVPVLTLRGDRLVSRQGVSLLANAGLEEWIAADPDDFVARASAFAADLPRLATLRAGLRERLLATPILDGARFARDFESAMREMWQRRASGGSAARDGRTPSP